MTHSQELLTDTFTSFCRVWHNSNKVALYKLVIYKDNDHGFGPIFGSKTPKSRDQSTPIRPITQIIKRCEQ